MGENVFENMNGRQKNSAWVKALSAAGVMVQFWDLSTAQTLGWVAKRLRQQGMKPTQEAVQLLTDRVEGNLLAAAQEIDKLKLLFGESPIDEAKIIDAVSDSSRFSVFDLTGAVSLGETKRIQHIMYHLRSEGVATPLVLWVLNELVTQLSDACFAIRNGLSLQGALAKVPKHKQKGLQPALKRLQSADWPVLIQKTIDIDRLIKGLSKVPNKGDARVWAELLALGLLLAGATVIKAEA